jgi:hypothetical protein
MPLTSRAAFAHRETLIAPQGPRFSPISRVLSTHGWLASMQDS